MDQLKSFVLFLIPTKIVMITRIQSGAITVVPLAFMPSLMMKLKNSKKVMVSYMKKWGGGGGGGILSSHVYAQVLWFIP